MIRPQQLTGIALLVFTTSACTTLRDAPLTPIDSIQQKKITEQRRQQLEQINSWDIRGRLAIDHDNDGFSAGLRWLQKQGIFQISLTDPLGRTAARLDGTSEIVTLRSQGEVYEDVDTTALMQSNLGWALPLDSLYHWSKGIPNPEFPLTAIAYDLYGRPMSLIQDGWQVEFKRYPDEQLLAQPAFISLRRDDFRAKLSIKSRK